MLKTIGSWRRLASILGMFLGILLVGQASQAAVHVVTLLANNTFSPNDITIQLGDRVDWVWTVGFHTVTDGGQCQSQSLSEYPSANEPN